MSGEAAALRTLREQMLAELEYRILPYWSQHAVDEAQGGFVGLIDADNGTRRDAPKGSVLNARILWTFSAAYRALRDPALRNLANRAAEYFASFFIDPVHGGVHWMLEASGRPWDVRKHVYAQSFAIYALSEHYHATGCTRSLRHAVEIFRLLERHAYDALSGGYHEAFTRDWKPLDDIRMNAPRPPSAGLAAASAGAAPRSIARRPRGVWGDEDVGARRTMNTHLHALEAFTKLHHVWPDALLHDRLCGIVALFLDRITDAEAGHVHEFFDSDWTPRPGVASYGHDIETSWLLLEAVGTAGCAGLRERARHASIRLAESALDEALDDLGGIVYRSADGKVDTDKEWWTQAEAIIGFLNAYHETGRWAFLDAAIGTWTFVRRHVLDNEHGEWHRRVSRDGTVRPGHEKAGPWKGPYHNARACLEVIRRIDRDLSAADPQPLAR